jgi:hypothetical protein
MEPDVAGKEHQQPRRRECGDQKEDDTEHQGLEHGTSTGRF